MKLFFNIIVIKNDNCIVDVCCTALGTGAQTCPHFYNKHYKIKSEARGSVFDYVDVFYSDPVSEKPSLLTPVYFGK